MNVWLKLIGGALLAIAVLGAGFEYAERFRRRTRSLESWISSLRLLGTEIVYYQRPLPEALAQLADLSRGPVAEFWKRLATDVCERRRPVPQAWTDCLQQHAQGVFVHRDEWSALAALGQALGTSDRMDQKHHLELCLSRIERAEREAHEEEARSVGLWRSLAAVTAVAIVVLLA